jgi:hypothetical protein
MSDDFRSALFGAVESVYRESPEGTFCREVDALVEGKLK